MTTQQMKDQGRHDAGAGAVLYRRRRRRAWPDPRFDSPTIRGFEARDAQYVNGLRQLRYMGAPAYETYGVQQVEVLRGPLLLAGDAGALLGDNSTRSRTRSGPRFRRGRVGL